MSTIQFVEFWQPKRAKHTRQGHDLTVSIALKGKSRKDPDYTISVERFLKRHKIDWKHIRFGQLGKTLIIANGDESNGFRVHANFRASNKDAVLNIFAFYDEKTPYREDEKKQLHFNAQYDDRLDLYILTRIID